MPKKHAKKRRSSYYSSVAKRRCSKKKRKSCSKCKLKQPKIRVPTKEEKVRPKESNESPICRDLSQSYNIEPRWPTSKRCATWLQGLPKRTYWSTGTTQSTKSNFSCEELQTVLDDETSIGQAEIGAGPSTRNHISSAPTYQDNQHRSHVTSHNPYLEYPFKPPANIRKSAETQGTGSSPYVSAKQMSDAVHESYLLNLQKNDKFFLKNLSHPQQMQISQSKPPKTKLQKCKEKFKEIERQKYISTPEKITISEQQSNNVPKPATNSGMHTCKSKPTSTHVKGASTLGWVILKIIYKANGGKCFPFNLFHMLRKKGFRKLSLSSLNQSLKWMEKKNLLSSSVDDLKHYPNYTLTSRGKSVLEKRMREIILAYRRNNRTTTKPTYKSMKKYLHS